MPCSQHASSITALFAARRGAEPFCLLAEPRLDLLDPCGQRARGGLVMPTKRRAMTADEQREFLRANGWVLHEGATAAAGQEVFLSPEDAAKSPSVRKTWYRRDAAVKACARRLGASS